MTAPYPLVFRPILLEKVWGGRRLARYGKDLPDNRPIGESWEIADLASTSLSGAGGGAARSIIADGPMAGRTLHEAMEAWGEDLLGAARPTSDGGFPLLVKFLDARESLSVQVHPSAAYAAAHPGCHVKSECWYVLEAEPGSVIYKGVRDGVTRERFAACVRDGTVVECLEAVPAVAGECHVLPSGTCHALGAGVLVAEVQTPSDTTFRLHDWGRSGRELHVEQALACVEVGPAPAAARAREAWDELARTECWSLAEASVAVEERTSKAGRPACEALVVIGGRGMLRRAEVEERPIPLAPGVTVLVPAAVRGYTLSPDRARPLTLLSVWLRS